jgi:GNAT superfamily N-acetyltransferase
MTVRPLEPRDREAFLAMWEEFVATDPAEPGDRGLGPLNWSRIEDGGCPLMGLVATDPEGRPAGFLLYAALPFTWSRGEVCYLEDLFVREGARGTGLGRRLIEALAEIGREKGWYKIFWMTQADNAAAQRLYERVALRRDYIRYDLPLSP